MIFNMMNYGGGGSVEDAFAIIKVTYPVGSTCTCTKDETGGIVLEAADKTGIAMFAVPESGRWGVACTNGTSTASEFVNATTRLAVYEVTLAYEPSPGPTPTPTETKIIASGYMVGAINATELNGDWNGGDVVIGTSAEWVVPNTGTYVVVYVPGDQSGAKTYFVNVTTLGSTYSVNLQTGAVEEIEPEPDPEPAVTTVITVTFPAGSISLADTSRVPIDSASGSNQSNTKTFNLNTGASYIITYSGTGGTYQEKTITASGATMAVSFMPVSQVCEYTILFAAGTLTVSDFDDHVFYTTTGAEETNEATFEGEKGAIYDFTLMATSGPNLTTAKRSYNDQETIRLGVSNQ